MDAEPERPAVAKQALRDAGNVGVSEQQHATGTQQAMDEFEQRARLGDMLKDVPHRDDVEGRLGKRAGL